MNLETLFLKNSDCTTLASDKDGFLNDMPAISKDKFIEVVTKILQEQANEQG